MSAPHPTTPSTTARRATDGAARRPAARSARPAPRVALGLGLALGLALAGCASGGPTGEASPEATGVPAPTAEPTPEPTQDAPSPSGTTSPSPSPSPLAPLQGLALEVVAEGVSDAVHVAAPPGDDRLFVVRRPGEVVLVRPDGTVADEPFLDLTGTVNANSIEQGLLSIAFHPAYPDDPRFFVFHSLASNDNQLVAYRVSDDPDRAEVDSAEVLLTVDKEPDKVRHNGGQLQFGPDGMLWLSVGDGARASVNGQDPTTILGAILRLDVDGGSPYAVPDDNPFADGDGGAPEVWAYGLRNPWRFWIDATDGLIYIGDVGQETFEEVNVVPIDSGGWNFGWPIMEGDEEFYGGEPAGELTPPALALDHASTPACSITGGVVYRGTAIPELDGTYLFADWCLGWIRSLAYVDGEATEVTDLSAELEASMVSSFGVDGAGEVLVVDHGAGTVSRVVPVR